jgi:hypothetical protein
MVDDNPDVLETVGRLLEADFEVQGKFASGAAALREIPRESHPIWWKRSPPFPKKKPSARLPVRPGHEGVTGGELLWLAEGAASGS